MKTFIWSWRLLCKWLVEAYFENVTGLAAMMAYDFIFLLAAPGLLLLSFLLSIFGTDPTTLHNIISILEGLMPQMSRQIIEQQVVALVITGSTSRVALLGIPLAIYLGINLINTISRTLNHCLGIKEPQRSWWNRWIIAVLLLFWFGVTSLFSFNAIVFGERLAAVIGDKYQLTIPLQEIVAALKYPIIALALTVLALALYLLTPEVYQTVRQALPGAIFFLGRLAGGDGALRRVRELFAVQRDVPGHGRDHHHAHVDVAHLPAAAPGRAAQRGLGQEMAHPALGASASGLWPAAIIIPTRRWPRLPSRPEPAVSLFHFLLL